jgi:hypothetical protein
MHLLVTSYSLRAAANIFVARDFTQRFASLLMYRGLHRRHDVFLTSVLCFFFFQSRIPKSYVIYSSKCSHWNETPEGYVHHILSTHPEYLVNVSPQLECMMQHYRVNSNSSRSIKLHASVSEIYHVRVGRSSGRALVLAVSRFQVVDELLYRVHATITIKMLYAVRHPTS